MASYSEVLKPRFGYEVIRTHLIEIHLNSFLCTYQPSRLPSQTDLVLHALLLLKGGTSCYLCVYFENYFYWSREDFVASFSVLRDPHCRHLEICSSHQVPSVTRKCVRTFVSGLDWFSKHNEHTIPTSMVWSGFVLFLIFQPLVFSFLNFLSTR